MRKVTTINLNNNAYQIDEDGYDALRAYLDRAERALANNPDRDEIISDLEQAIADKCRLALGPHKTVVSVAEIERILAEMGPVAGGADDASSNTAGGAGAAGAAAESAQGAAGYRPRRLYRIREGQTWAGICQGLAAFAGVDVTLVRVAVVLITIFTGFFPGFFIYILMCFLIPVAATPEELAAAYGQPFRAQEVVDRVKKKHDEWRSDRGNHRMRHSWWSPQTVPTPPPGYAARVTGGIMLPILTVMSAVWFAAMATVAYLVWQGWNRMGFHNWPPGNWEGYNDFPRWAAIVAVVAIYALLAIPIGTARRASLHYANGGRLHGWADAWSGLLWFALVAVMLLGAWFWMPQAEQLLRLELLENPGVITL
jgi:phage shock protein PspC (stress-responsive transcriptional regulator)